MFGTEVDATEGIIYNIAKKNLENFFFVGEFENFDEDIKKLSKKLNFNFDKTPHVVVYSKKSHITKNEDHVNLISSYNNYDLKLELIIKILNE